jgi:uncharacterized protein YecE (DUF72 family)
LYASGYDDVELARWAKRIKRWRSGREPGDAEHILPLSRSRKRRRARDIFVYFDNDAKVFAPFNAQHLAELL